MRLVFTVLVILQFRPILVVAQICSNSNDQKFPPFESGLIDRVIFDLHRANIPTIFSQHSLKYVSELSGIANMHAINLCYLNQSANRI